VSAGREVKRRKAIRAAEGRTRHSDEPKRFLTSAAGYAFG
jgi:hypothetical protein